MLKQFVISFISDMLSESLGRKALTGILSKASGRGKPAEVAGGDTSAPEIKHGGVFDLTDERAYFALVGQMETDPIMQGEAKKLSSFMNRKLKTAQKRRLRACIGMLAQTEYTKEVFRDKVTRPNRHGKPTVEEKTREVKSNLGLDFIRSFVKLTDTEKLAVCKASGIMDSTLEKIEEGTKNLYDKLESMPIVNNTTTFLGDKIKKRIDALKARKGVTP